MATISTINIGNIVNDGLGDDLRTAFQKVNANFTSLNAALTVTASNLGTVGEGIFNRKDGANLEFKRLVAGNKINIISNPDSITISNTEGQSFRRITTQNGYVDANNFQYVTMQGNPDVVVSATGDVITVGTRINLNQTLKVTDFGPINGVFDNLVQLNLALSNVDFGTFTNPSYFSMDQGTFSGAALDPIDNPLLFSVTTNEINAYLLDSVANPTITLIRGNTYFFDLNVTGNPFWIKTARVAGTSDIYVREPGIITNNGSTFGRLTFIIDDSTPNTLYYVNENNITMSGQINIVPVRAFI